MNATVLWLVVCLNAECTITKPIDQMRTFYGTHAESLCENEAMGLDLSAAQAGTSDRYRCAPNFQISGPRPVASQS
jgi:hypothetical protein